MQEILELRSSLLLGIFQPVLAKCSPRQVDGVARLRDCSTSESPACLSVFSVLNSGQIEQQSRLTASV